MSRARTSNTDSNWQTAAPEQGSGCFTGFIIPPLAVLLVGILMIAFVSRLDTPVQAASSSNQGDFAASLSTNLSPIFRPEIQHWADSITRWAAASDLDPNLVAVVMQIESCGDPRATSRAGAMGLFQVMPFHFLPAENPYHPDTNALRGLGYLKRSLDAAGGNPRRALAGYNGGIGVIKRSEYTWAAETRRYVYYGEPIYMDASRGATSSPMLDEWYARYGASLCRQAAQRLGIIDY